jgi:ribosome biogenesis GTPase A
MGYWGVVLNSIKNSDVILLVLDARIPEETQNAEIQKRAELMKKRLIYVFNKTDLVNAKLLKKLKEKYGDAFFTSSKKKGSVLKIMKFLEGLASGRRRALRVGVLGYPNVGKSSVLNILTKSREKVSDVSGTTKKTKWIRVGNLRFMDTPGVIPRKDTKTKVALTSSKDIYKTENPEKIAYRLISKLMGSKILEKNYKIKVSSEDDENDIFERIARKKGFLLKGNEIDEDKTARLIVGDW